MESELSQFVEDLQRFAPVFLESYVVVDHERNVVDFNPAFFSMLPRETGRGLVGKNLGEVLQIATPEGADVIDRCWQLKKHMRLEDMRGSIVGDDNDAQRFTISVLPVLSEAGDAIGALLLIKVVTSQIELRDQYQALVDGEADQRHRLEERLKTRTSELLRAYKELEEAQKELLDFKRGLLV